MKKKAKYIKLDDLLKMLKNGDKIVGGMAANEPQLTISNLHRAFDDYGLNSLEYTNCLGIRQDSPVYTEKYADKIEISSWFYDPAIRKAHQNGNASFIPNYLHYAHTKRFERVKYDYFISAASMPDEHGFVSLSTCNVYEKAAIRNAKVTVLEINPNFPRTFGDLEVHISEVDYLIETDYPCPTLPDVPLNEKDIAIGKLIAERIEDGSSIQLGIGGIPNAVAEQLKGKKDLGIHTEMFTSTMVDLIECGAVTGKKKKLYPGKHVAAFAFGNQKLYDFINNNPSVLIMDGAWVNDPYVIGQNDKQVSINAALEVSLDGQVASESIGTRQFSGAGGQVDTAVGAQNSKGGKSFIALYSTAMVRNPETGEREPKSKIVPYITPGGAVTLSRADVDNVVTEYGVAELRGTTLKERAVELIKIAHPDFREELFNEGVAIGILSERDRPKLANHFKK
ncbi:MAG: acetyl-CoA hydrolase/transferase family protein [Acholeplasmataceae bacterium]|jgi:acyl-CoA hydrolase